MACIIWKLFNGTEYLVTENTAHTPPPGAENTGKIDWNCAPTPMPAPGDPFEVDEHLNRGGVKWGSVIAWATSKAGIKKCTACAARELILNNVKEVGWTETLKAITATFKDT